MTVTIRPASPAKVKVVEFVEVPARPATITVELTLLQALLFGALQGCSTGHANIGSDLRCALIDAGYEEHLDTAAKLARTAIEHRESGSPYQNSNLSWHVVQQEVDALAAALEGA